MNIKVTRQHFTENCTIGELTIEGDDFKCYTLEDKDRKLTSEDSPEFISDMKVYGKTAIPYGTYELAVTFSNRFKRFLPILLNVKGFEGIRIHTGNDDGDTHGCLLVGTEKDVVNNRILNSRTAFAELMLLINERIIAEKVFVEITNLNKPA